MSDKEEKQEIVLDGSLGFGVDAKFTVVTKDAVYGDREATYVFPYALIDQETLSKFLSLNFIVGYSITKMPPAPKEG